MPTLLELTQERAKILTQATEISAKMKQDGRDDLNTEERATIDNISKRAGELETEISQAEEEQRAAEQSRKSFDNLLKNAASNTRRRGEPPQNRNAGKKVVPVEETDEYRAYFDAAFKCDYRGLNEAHQALETRALSLGTNASGGYMVLPTALLNLFVSNIDELSEFMSLVNKIEIGEAKALGISKITARADDADWTGEITSVTADTNLAFGRRDFTPWMLTKEVDASLSLLQRSPQAQPIVFRQMARLFAVTQEKAGLTGSGSSQPLGIFIASANGISTARDIVCGSATAPAYVDIVSLKYNLKAVHLNSPKTRLFCHRDFAKNCLTILDSQNRPIFIPSDKPGLADTILGMTTSYSEFAPHTFTAGLYVAVVGDMDDYYWVTGMPYSIQVADQLAARTNQVAFLGRTEADGAPMLEEAFSRLRMA